MYVGILSGIQITVSYLYLEIDYKYLTTQLPRATTNWLVDVDVDVVLHPVFPPNIFVMRNFVGGKIKIFFYQLIMKTGSDLYIIEL